MSGVSVCECDRKCRCHNPCNERRAAAAAAANRAPIPAPAVVSAPAPAAVVAAGKPSVPPLKQQSAAPVAAAKPAVAAANVAVARSTPARAATAAPAATAAAPAPVAAPVAAAVPTSGGSNSRTLPPAVASDDTASCTSCDGYPAIAAGADSGAAEAGPHSKRIWALKNDSDSGVANCLAWDPQLLQERYAEEAKRAQKLAAIHSGQVAYMTRKEAEKRAKVEAERAAAQRAAEAAETERRAAIAARAEADRKRAKSAKCAAKKAERAQYERRIAAKAKRDANAHVNLASGELSDGEADDSCGGGSCGCGDALSPHEAAMAAQREHHRLYGHPFHAHAHTHTHPEQQPAAAPAPAPAATAPAAAATDSSPLAREVERLKAAADSARKEADALKKQLQQQQQQSSPAKSKSGGKTDEKHSARSTAAGTKAAPAKGSSAEARAYLMRRAKEREEKEKADALAAAEAAAAQAEAEAKAKAAAAAAAAAKQAAEAEAAAAGIPPVAVEAAVESEPEVSRSARARHMRAVELQRLEAKKIRLGWGLATRSNADSWMAFQTGKPAFAPYGQGNVHPTVGGVYWGNYMLSHSIAPSVLPNVPERPQTYTHPRNTRAVSTQNERDLCDDEQTKEVKRAARRLKRVLKIRKALDSKTYGLDSPPDSSRRSRAVDDNPLIHPNNRGTNQSPIGVGGSNQNEYFVPLTPRDAIAV